MQKLSIFSEVGLLRVSVDSEICRKSSILHGHLDFARLCSSLPKFDQWSEYPQSFTQALPGLLGMFLAIHFSYVSFNVQELWGLESGWFGQNLSGKTSIWKGHNSYSLRNTLDKCIAKTFDFPRRRFAESFSRFRDLPKIEHFAWALGFCSIVLELAKIWSMIRISSMFHKTLPELLWMFLLYISLMYILMCRSYEALNADGLDKTSRPKLQFEKVIIPIL